MLVKIAFSSIVSSNSIRVQFNPYFLHLFFFILTYVKDSFFAPTRTIASPGVLFDFITDVFIASYILLAISVPDIT